ncbi:MAG: ABC transporter ATP-binding protein [Bdellovibrionota bacterium]
MSVLIEVSDVVKTYRRGAESVPVLNHLSLTIDEGEFIALMGPSGSGKTTLLNLIAGFDRADSGSIRISGQDLTPLSESERARWRVNNIGFVFQFYNLIPVLSAIENVALPLSLLKMSHAERMERAQFALEVVGLKDRGSHLPAQLSGGQEQRVAIARAIVTDPRILVADEPTGDLDRTSATEVLELMQALNREHKKTIVIVTHDPVAAEYGTRTVHFDKGNLKDT